MKNIIHKLDLFMKRNRKYMLLLFDICVIIIAHMISIFVFNKQMMEFIMQNIYGVCATIGISIITYMIIELVLDVYSNITRYENGNDYLKYMYIGIIASLIDMITLKLLKIDTFSINSLIFISFLIIIGMITYRVIIRTILLKDTTISFKESLTKKKLLIIGAGTSARDVIKTIRQKMKNEYEIIGMIDDNINKLNYSISGVKVIGNSNDIQEICKTQKIDMIFFTIVDIKANRKKYILDICQKTVAKIRVLPNTECIIKDKNIIDNLRDLNIEDILCREQVNLDNSKISNLIEDNIILVTGGGGSIGSELCRQIMKYNPKKLVILDIYENSLYDIQMELNDNYDKNKIECIIGSVRDKKRLENIFEKYLPNLVFHAAAHKHVPLMEGSPLEAIKNNVFGTYNVVCCADKYNVKKFILISSDKAVNPTNIMGATKRFCEMIIQAKNKISKTDYVAVRFGNVLGSNGSVVPLFKKQIEKGGPITVTDRRITRFFMTIPEAVQLILQATTYAKGGEIFVLDMGEPVKIYDLAENLIKLSGLRPNIDIQIEIIGLRPGEKLYEELLMKEEGLTNTEHDKIYIAKPIDISMDKIEKRLETLSLIIENESIDCKMLEDSIKKIVPTYKKTKYREYEVI